MGRRRVGKRTALRSDRGYRNKVPARGSHGSEMGGGAVLINRRSIVSKGSLRWPGDGGGVGPQRPRDLVEHPIDKDQFQEETETAKLETGGKNGRTL